jgi:hypothetical protein
MSCVVGERQLSFWVVTCDCGGSGLSMTTVSSSQWSVGLWKSAGVMRLSQWEPMFDEDHGSDMHFLADELLYNWLLE